MKSKPRKVSILFFILLLFSTILNLTPSLISVNAALTTQLTYNTGYDLDPSVNGDGTEIAFTSDRDGDTELFLMNIDGSGQTQLTSDFAWVRDPAISSDGTKIAFRSDVDGDDEIYVINSDGSGLTQLTDSIYVENNPCISSDGSKIAFVSFGAFLPGSSGDGEICVVNSDNTGLTQLTNNGDIDVEPSISGDGIKIAFCSDRDGDHEIFVMNNDGSGLTQLTNNGDEDRRPSISADGSKIAFYSDRDGDYEIFVMNIDGSGQTQLTDNGVTDWLPSISGDGTKIAFESTYGGGYSVWVVNSDGSGLTQLTTNSASDRFPSINNDGTKITYYSNSDGDYEIFVIELDKFETSASLNVSPNPQTVGYALLIVGDIDPSPPMGYFYSGITVTVTEPTGITVPLGPFTSDAEGQFSTSYTPTWIGTYRFDLYKPENNLGGEVYLECASSPVDVVIQAEVPTSSSLSVTPNPTTQDYLLQISGQVIPAPPSGHFYSGIEVTVELPTTTTETLGPFTSNAAGQFSTAYAPSLVGDYGFYMNTPSQYLDVGYAESTSPTVNVPVWESFPLLTIVDPPEGGTVHRDPDDAGAGYAYGTVVTLTADTGNPGYTFSGWSGDGVPGTGMGERVITVTSPNMEVTAHYIPYGLTVNISPEGTGFVSAEPDPFGYNQEVLLTAYPALSGWVFDHWEGDLTGNTNPEILLIDGEKTVSAYFVLEDWVLTQLTTNTASDAFASISGDGSKIAFQSDVDGDLEIYVVNSDGTGLTQLTDNTANDAIPSISSDGSKVTFRSNVGGDNEIYVVNSDGTGLTQLTDNTAGENRPVISGDGSKIAFESNRDGDYEIFVVNSDGTGLTKLTDNAAGDEQPSISFDGSKVAFISNIDGDWDVYVVNSDGSGLTPLTFTTNQEFYPQISGDGSKITFHSSLGGAWTIWVIDSDGSDLTQLTFDTGAQTNPVISFDGSKIAFDSNVDGDFEIFVVKSDGTGLTQLTSNTADDRWPVISGDGSKIAFESDVDGDYEIFLLSTDPVEYALAVTTVGGGSVVASGGPSYSFGNIVELTANADLLWAFDHWEGDLTGSDNPATITMTGDKAVTAYFTAIPQGLTFNNVIYSTTVVNQSWSYLITDITTGLVVEDFTLPAFENSTTAFTGAPFLSGGVFNVTAIPKYRYETEIAVIPDGGSSAVIDEEPWSLNATVTLAAGGGAIINFTNWEFAISAVPIDMEAPANFEVTIPPYAIIPVQAAWNPDMNIDKDTIGDGKLDLVAGKPTAVIINATNPNDIGAHLTLYVKSAGSTELTVETDVLANGVAAFYFTLYNDDAAGETLREVEFSVDGLTESVGPVTVDVRTTRDMSLFWGILQETSKYTVPTVDELATFMEESNKFIEAVFPVKDVIANDPSAEGIDEIEIKKSSKMKNECINVATKALERGHEVGVVVVNTDYFDNYRKLVGAAGISYGPNTKGVIVAYDYPTAAAHEVAHTFWVYWGVPENYQQNPLWGDWASGWCPGLSAADGIEWRTGYDFMGCASGGTTLENWVNSAGTYNNLFGKLYDPSVDPEIVIVSGVYSDGGDTLETPVTWSTVSSGVASQVSPGGFAIRFVDDLGEPVGEDTSFGVEFYESINWGVGLGEDAAAVDTVGTVPSDEAVFAFAVATPEEEYAAIQVLDKREDPENPVVQKTISKEQIVNADLETDGYFTDSDYNLLESFECVFTPDKQAGADVYKMSATNPGTYRYNLAVTNKKDPSEAFTLEVEIPSAFVLKPPRPGANPVRLDGEPVDYVFNEGVLTVSGVVINVGETRTLSVHLDYALKHKYDPDETFTKDDQTTFLRGYAFAARVNSNRADSGTVAAMGKKVTAIGGFLLDVHGVPKGGLTVRVTSGGATVGESIASTDGFYFVLVEPGGPYKVEITNSLDDPVGPKEVLSISKDEFIELNFDTLSPADPAILGFVKDGLSGVSDVTVQLLSKNGKKVLAEKTTNLGGYYVFRFYQPGTYWVRVVVPEGYAAVEPVQLLVRQFDEARVDFTLTLTS